MNKKHQHFMLIKYSSILLFLIFNYSVAQTAMNNLKFWELKSLDGSIMLESYYRIQETLLKSNFNENQKSSIVSGQLSLNSKSFILHPNFLYMDFAVDFRPGLQKDNFLVIPDRSETRTMEKINFHSTFFQERPFSLNFFTNFIHNFINREYTSNVEIYHHNIGSSLLFRNYIIPISFNLSRDNWEQNEIESGRKFSTQKYLLSINLKKSFGEFDSHNFKYSYEDNKRNNNIADKIQTSISTANLKNSIYFNKDHSSSLKSFILFDARSGDRKIDRLQFNENMMLRLPYNFDIVSNFRNVNYKQEDMNYKQNNISTTINHRIYSSIQTSLKYEYNDLNHSSYHEFYNIKGVSANYKKKIPTGTLSLFYDYSIRNENRNSAPELLKVVDERIQLDDLTTVLLKNPFVKINSIIVTDLSKTVIYQENMDYVIVEQGNYIEIQRLPGGQIQNDQFVLLEYLTEKPLSYDFNTVNNAYGIYLMLFENTLELYARSYSQKFNDISLTENRIFKNIEQNVYGGKISYSFVTAGVEFTNFASNIVPFNSKRYYLNFSKTIDKTKFIISGKRREHTLTETDENQIFSDIAGKIIYQINNDSKIKIDGGYRVQEGREMDLTLLTARGEYLTKYRQIYFTLGFEMYKRNFSGEKINFNSGYLKIERLF
jgi:hypothetical protein